MVKFSLSLFLLCSTVSANIFDKGIDFKEGVVHYSLSGGVNGSKTLYIKEHGKRRVIYTNTKNSFMKKTQTQDQVLYITPKWTYEINLKKSLTTKLPNFKYLLLQKYKSLPKSKQKIIEKNLKLRSFYNTTGVVKSSKQKILDYSCQVESIDGKNTFIAKNSDLILKTKTAILGFNQTTVATKIERKSLNTDLFTLPRNLTIIDSSKKREKLEKKADEILNSLLTVKHTKEKNHQKDDLSTAILDSAEKLGNL